ncbi:hypothetical protein H6G20_06065 [Desertifilum sp. FACHB-1129]|uniref:hypothetical protein n=1 Tax=unclassified Desertifilum TaxID=2621682 RepID=UPI0016821DA9|nr:MULTISPECIES: hypothetical protein [unclassified Desertifilum]MBD2311222.1 hypothetical protein [Desertifilum sp. FACHB-1129]MBD2324333.1 hypothetical protein [Desertifilum sp. FACHB-866]MBD2334347.1 hypothetical protein [Desertifilum sp. FACHB-868]MDA0213194.1 hypothetical protein [Cyanobacteria bacterium FC1]
MEPTHLSCPIDQQALIQEATIQEFHSHNWKQIQAAIFIAETTYILKHKVDDCPPRFTYKCLSPEALQRAFHLEALDSQWLPPGLIRHGSTTGGEWAALFIPPGKHRLHLPGRTRTLPLPGFVLVGLNKDYRLWAIATQQFEPTARAYLPPLPNVYESGAICWGTISPPEATPQSMPQAWQLFITSSFTNHLVLSKSRAHNLNILDQLTRLGRRKTYPLDDLLSAPVPAHRSSIADLIEGFVL